MVWLIILNIICLIFILVSVYDIRKSINSFIKYDNYYYKFYESIKDLKGDCDFTVMKKFSVDIFDKMKRKIINQRNEVKNSDLKLLQN